MLQLINKIYKVYKLTHIVDMCVHTCVYIYIYIYQIYMHFNGECPAGGERKLSKFTVQT